MSMMTISTFWLLFSFICFLGELSSPGLFYLLSCSIVAFGLALGNHYAELPLAMQGLIFVIGFLFIFFVLHHLMKKIDERRRPQYISHLASLIHQEGTALTGISSDTPGQLAVHNETWLAYAANKGQVIKKGEHVIVVGIKGAHLIIKSKEKS